MRQVSWRDRARYRFDNTMTAGTVALIGWLGLASLALIVVITLVVKLLGIGPRDENGESLDMFHTMWFGLMRTLDAGTMGGDSGRWPFLFAMLGVTLGGVFVVSTLIGVLTSGIEGKLDELRKGRSFVVESGHTLILGWSPQIFTVLSELVIANQNQKRACIVVLAEMDKVEMEDAIRSKLGDSGRTRIVCRSGSPIDLADLEIANPHRARAIIILAPAVEDPDAHVIKTILALTNNPGRRPEPYHIVAEIRDPRNVDVVKMVGRDEVQLIRSGELISRIAVQTSRQSGLSIVYTELLDFDGDEIYFQHLPALAGTTFGDALLAFEDSALIGLRFADGRVQLAPGMDVVIEPRDAIIAVSRDDDTVRPNGPGTTAVDRDAIRQPPTRTPAPERTLVLGFNQRAPRIISELDQYVAPGSDLVLVAGNGHAREAIDIDGVHLRHLRVETRSADTTDRRALEALEIASFDHIIVLAASDDLPPQEADARTLITLLHLRDMAEKAGHGYSITSEMLDVRNRELAEVTRADDFIVSDTLASLLFAQIAENRDLAAVFDDLFDADGVELYLKPAADYVEPDRPLRFATVVESARQRGEVAIGYRQRSGAGDASRAYGVVVNPPKSAIVTFGPDDKVIVLAEA